MANQLIHSSSPYLRQHAENPVPWWPWCTEAFEEAGRRDVPVFVSIGYSACHWCHVMAGESFADPAVAQVLSEGFVSIKVDREEHPDVDDAYMAVTQGITGQGGWPMSVFTTPEGRAFHAGTYFPPQRRGSMPGFTEVLEAVSQAWTQRREQVEESALSIAEAAGRQRQQQARLATEVREADAEARAGESAHDLAERLDTLAAQAVSALEAQEDTEHGGYGAAPKFPPSPVLGFLIGEAARGNVPARGQAQRTLSAMIRSALFDQVEGGFARYATDRVWALPHFEKMLYDNAQLIGHCARLAGLSTVEPGVADDARRAALLSVDWLRRRMLLDDGLLASSLDADTVEPDGTHVEGGTYLFTDEQLREAASAAGLTDDDAERLVQLNAGVPADHAHVGPHTPRTLHFRAPLDADERELFDAVLPELRRMRSERTQPARDDKVVTAWNAMAVASLAETAAVLDAPEALDLAESVADALWATHVTSHSADQAAEAGDGVEVLTVARLSYAGQATSQAGTLADYAHLASACFALTSAGADPVWASRGVAVLRRVIRDFITDQQAEVETPDSAESTAPPRAVIEALDAGGLLEKAQNGPSYATPLDGPEPSGIAALAAAVQMAEALQLSGELVVDGQQPPEPHELLHHLDLLAPEAPGAVGASLRVARQVAASSPAFRVAGATSKALAEVRRAAAVYAVPVEPVEASAVREETPEEGPQLQLSVCLSGPQQRLCKPPVASLEQALAGI